MKLPFQRSDPVLVEGDADPILLAPDDTTGNVRVVRLKGKIEALGRPASSVLRVFQHAQTHPILSIGATAEKTAISFPTVSSAVEHMRRLGLLREITGKRRKRLFVYNAYLAILSEGTEALPR